MITSKIEKHNEESLLQEISVLIEQSQKQISIQANSALVLLFWQVGNSIHTHILNNKRADYGKQLSLHCHDN